MTDISRSKGKTHLLTGFALFAMTALLSAGGCADAGEPEPGIQEGEFAASDDAARLCTSDDQCGRGLTCDKASCDARFGACVPQSRACPDVWEPECGCDGKTYSNRCERVGAGVDLKHPGECGPRSCDPSSRRCDDGETCIYKTGVCGTEPGVCLTPPTGCPRIWDPVCGCDGQTYSNECHAHSVGVSVSYEGECEPQGCAGNADCGREQYCAFPDGFCVEETGIRPVGECETRPRFCLDVYEPVCGCDGQTYGNRCYAASAGVNVKYEGVCEAPCRKTAECPDPAGQVCKQEGCEEPGVCVARPEACPMIYQPVCGCDGQTYGNACVAAQHGVTVKSEGECRCDGRTGNTCDKNEFCDHDPGMCATREPEGVCVEVGEFCLAVYDPVCGCDGVTYSSDCDRIQNRAQKAHHGACECPPVCAIACPYGHVLDRNGCATCSCLPGPGPGEPQDR